jgi:hypothetical protein
MNKLFFQSNEGGRVVTAMVVCESCLISIEVLFLFPFPHVPFLFFH